MRPDHSTDHMITASASQLFSWVLTPALRKESSMALITGTLFLAHCKGK
jgi:hypothetical protein